MNLSNHFSLDEMTHTEQRGLDNTCPGDLLSALAKTAGMMERIRAALSAEAGREIAIAVTSGYRSRAVNKAVGSTNPESDHIYALACDFKAPGYGSPFVVATFLAKHRQELGIGQLIYEGRWVHVSRLAPVKAINNCITVTAQGPVAGIVEVRDGLA